MIEQWCQLVDGKRSLIPISHNSTPVMKKIFIKNINCPCSERHAIDLIEAMGFQVTAVDDGEITLAAPMTTLDRALLDEQLRPMGMELLHAPKNVMIEKVKSMLHAIVRANKDPLKINLSDHLSEKLQYNYSYISNIFSKSEGVTIRDFGIRLRIDLAKRMLLDEGLDLHEVAKRLNYSSAAHLAAQFKKIAGMTTTEFKRAESVTSPAIERTA